MLDKKVKLVPGKVVGKWTLVRRTRAVVGNRTVESWMCRCVCGAEHIRYARNLAIGRTKACPKCRAKKVPVHTFEVGGTFGFWTLIRKTRDCRTARGRMWLASCTCGYQSFKSEEALVRTWPCPIRKCQACTNRELGAKRRKVQPSLTS